MAGPGRHVEPEWLAHQSGSQILDFVERRFLRQILLLAFRKVAQNGQVLP